MENEKNEKKKKKNENYGNTEKQLTNNFPCKNFSKNV